MKAKSKRIMLSLAVSTVSTVMLPIDALAYPQRLNC